MSLQINTFDDLLHIVNTHPEWRRRLVKALFPEIDLPKALQELIESNRLMRAQLGNVEVRLTTMEDRQTRTEDRQTRMEGQMARMEGQITRVEGQITRVEDRQTRTEIRIDRIEKRLTSVEGSVATLKGNDYEDIVNKKAESIFGFALRRGRDNRNEFSAQLDLAEHANKISAEEYIQVMAADLLWLGRLKSSNENITLAIETSWFAEQNDLDRALARAAILQKIGVRALPVVAAKEWTDDMLKVAREQKVIVVQDLSLDKQSWDTVLAATPLTTLSEN